MWDIAQDSKLTDQLLKDLLTQTKIRYVGLSVLSSQANDAKRLIALIKSISPSTTIIVGGQHIDANGGFDFTAADFVVHGEGEIILRQIVSGTTPITTQLNGIPVDDLDTVPLPDTATLTYYSEIGTFTEQIGLMVSRGCPFQCSFCLKKDSNMRRQRRYTPRMIGDLLERISEVSPQKKIAFLDDIFTLNKEWTLELCSEIRRRNLDHLSFECLSHVHIDDKEIYRAISQAGFKKVSLGIESGDPEILKRMNKPITLDQARRTVEIIRDCGMEPHGLFILGYAGDTCESMQRTLDFASSLDASLWFSIAQPLPGTDFFKTAQVEGTLLEKDCTRYHNERIVYLPEGVKLQEMQQVQQKAETLRKLRNGRLNIKQFTRKKNLTPNQSFGGTGNYQNMGETIGWIRALDPVRVLDVGCGFGRWGLMCREFLDIWNGRTTRERFRTRIWAVEAFSANIQAHHQHLYDRIFNMKIQDFFATQKEKFDLIIVGDVLEHLSKSDSLSIIDIAMQRSQYVLLVLPIGPDWPQDSAYGNPFEQHLSIWTTDDVQHWHPVKTLLCHDEFKRPFLSAVLSAEDPKCFGSSLDTPIVPSRMRSADKLDATRPVPCKEDECVSQIAPHRLQKPLHLALVTMEYPPDAEGGIGTYAFHLARLMGQYGHHVSIITKFRGDRNKIIAIQNVDVHCLPPEETFATGGEHTDALAIAIHRGRAISMLLVEIHSHRPIDIIETTDYYMDRLVIDTTVLEAADGSPIPVVTQFHSPASVISTLDGKANPFTAKLENLHFNQSRYNKTYSPRMRDQVNRLWPETNCVFVPSPFFCPTMLSEEDRQSPSTPFSFDILFFGRLQRVKGIEYFASALKKTAARIGDLNLCLIGNDTDTAPDGGSMAMWLEFTLRPIFGSKLHIKESMAHDKLQSLIRSARVIVIPSLWESLGFAALESFCSGRPVICSELIGATYVIPEKIRPLSLVNVRNTDAFADRMVTALSMTESERCAWGQSLKNAVISNFSPGEVLDATVACYEKYILDAKKNMTTKSTIHTEKWLLPVLEELVSLAAKNHIRSDAFWNELKNNQRLMCDLQRQLSEARFSSFVKEIQKAFLENKLTGQDSFLIFGASDYGRRIYSLLQDYGAKIVGIYDNDHATVPFIAENIKVTPPQAPPHGSKVIVASVGSSMVMEEQIHSLAKTANRTIEVYSCHRFGI